MRTRPVFAILSFVLATQARGAEIPAPVSEAERSFGNGLTIRYRVAGNGRPLLLLHGFGMNGSSWSRFVPDFASTHRLVMPDLRGHGGSSNPDSQFSHRVAASDAFALLDSLGITRFDAIGYSSGAATLIHMATQQPDRIGKMVLIASAHRFAPNVREKWRTYPSLERLPPAVREYLLSQHGSRRGQVETLLAQFRAMADDYEDMNFSPEKLSTIMARTLIVVGDGDDCPLEAILEMYRAIPRAQLLVVPGADHYFMWEEFGGSPEVIAFFRSMTRRFVAAED